MRDEEEELRRKEEGSKNTNKIKPFMFGFLELDKIQQNL